MADKTPVRNYDGIQFAGLRQEVEGPFNAFHDALSAAYYGEKPAEFIYKEINYGVMHKSLPKTKEKFDELHGLIFDHLFVALHTANTAKAMGQRIPEDSYRYVKDKNGNIKVDKLLQAQTKITDMKNTGIEIKV